MIDINLLHHVNIDSQIFFLFLFKINFKFTLSDAIWSFVPLTGNNFDVWLILNFTGFD